MSITERVPGHTEVMDLPQGTEVLDNEGHPWVVGGRDGSCIKMTINGARGFVRFYQQVRMIDGAWRFTNDEGEVENV